MPSANLSSTVQHDDLDNYDVNDFSEDPFGSPPPESANKKRKEPESGLGIDQEVSVQKRARAPNVKLDEKRLLDPKGLPKLRKRARDLKIKGKGHEFSDAARLLSFYQLWLDDLFPKARFLDALNMVEKAGHKKEVTEARKEYINEGKPNLTATADDGDEDNFITGDDNIQHTEEPTLPLLNDRPKTPEPSNDIPDDDDDLYDATPRPVRPALPIRNEKQPDEDGLEALIAEAKGQGRAKNADPQADPEQDDLDALMAEVEEEDNSRQKESTSTENTTNGAPGNGNSFEDDEAAMQELEGLW